MVHGMELPRIGVVAANHDLGGAHLRHQVADRLRREDQRIEIDLLEIVGRLLLELDVRIAALWSDQTGMIGAVGIRGQEAAARRGDHPQAGEAIEGALEDEMRERDRIR